MDMDVFNQDPFTLVSLTQYVNNQPAIPGQVGAIVDFQEEGITTTDIALVSINGLLQLVEPSERGGPGETVDHAKNNYRKLATAHLQRDEFVKADEIQNVRDASAIGQPALMTIEQLVHNKLNRHLVDFDLTEEWMKLGVLRGKVISGKGKTIIDIYKEFDLTAPAAITFDLADDAFEFRDESMELIMQMEDDLLAPSYGHVHTLCGRDFFRSILKNKQFKESFLNTPSAAALRDAQPDKVEMGGVTFERYKSSAVARQAVGGNFIADDEAISFFVGVPGLYITRYAPADYWDTVNTMGLPRYASELTEERTSKRAKFEVQSNPIHLITQPKTLRRLKLAP